jgi:hypothetical protein
MKLIEVRDDWRKKRSYYEQLTKGPGIIIIINI